MMYSFSGLLSPVRLPASGGPALRKKRGFNLIESAIVLGVVGLVIGGIWVAASVIIERNRQASTSEMMALAVNKLRTTLKEVPGYTYADSYNLTSLAIAVGAIPSNGKTPYGLINVTYETDYGGRDFVVQIYGLSSGACSVLVNQFANGASSNGLTRVVINPYAVSRMYTSFPIAISTITDRCNSTNGTLDFQFNY